MELTTKQLAFLDALFSPDAKGNVNKAFDLAGYAKDAANRRQVTKELAEQIVERAKEYLAAVSVKAVMGLDNCLDDPTALGNKSTIAAAREVLDRVGIVKKEQVEVSGNVGGLFILPPKDGEKEDE